MQLYLALVLSSPVLNIKVPETLKSVPNPFGGSVVGGSNSVGNKSVAFDWVPPDVSEDLVSCVPQKSYNERENHLSCMVYVQEVVTVCTNCYDIMNCEI